MTPGLHLRWRGRHVRLDIEVEARRLVAWLLEEVLAELRLSIPEGSMLTPGRSHKATQNRTWPWKPYKP